MKTVSHTWLELESKFLHLGGDANKAQAYLDSFLQKLSVFKQGPVSFSCAERLAKRIKDSMLADGWRDSDDEILTFALIHKRGDCKVFTALILSVFQVIGLEARSFVEHMPGHVVPVLELDSCEFFRFDLAWQGAVPNKPDDFYIKNLDLSRGLVSRMREQGVYFVPTQKIIIHYNSLADTAFLAGAVDLADELYGICLSRVRLPEILQRRAIILKERNALEEALGALKEAELYNPLDSNTVRLIAEVEELMQGR